jgi:hypothetical protein
MQIAGSNSSLLNLKSNVGEELSWDENKDHHNKRVGRPTLLAVSTPVERRDHSRQAL